MTHLPFFTEPCDPAALFLSVHRHFLILSTLVVCAHLSIYFTNSFFELTLAVCSSTFTSNAGRVPSCIAQGQASYLKSKLPEAGLAGLSGKTESHPNVSLSLRGNDGDFPSGTADKKASQVAQW